ncbi:MAG: FAD-dependent oxidoreductase [Clostridia bacterium]|nr:FAD-dependent oxidoreductase [Clostridia bacterium]
MSKYVILGGGVAGFSAALKIKELEKDAEITIVNGEKDIPYLRPLLSKTDLRTFQNRKISMADKAWYEDNCIELLNNTKAEFIDRTNRKIRLSDGNVISYDKCIYALGAKSFVPDIKGINKKGVLTLRNTEDFKNLRRIAVRSKNAVVIGGGVIGLETAWELHKAGLNVKILESAPWLMSRQLDDESAEYLTNNINSIGIECYTDVSVLEILGDEKAGSVKLSDGRTFYTDSIVVSTGIRANTELAENIGLSIDRAVIVDKYMRTDDENIFAAGDCIQGDFVNPGLWAFSQKSGETAGANAVSIHEEFRPENYPLVMTAMNTAVFSVGNITDYDYAETTISDGRKDIPEFTVNRYDGCEKVFDRRFYKSGKLCGAILIGDISAMYEITEEPEAVK